MTARFWLQLITLAIAIYGLGTWARYLKTKAYIAIPVIVWLIHVAVFYAAVLFVSRPELGNVFFTTWSAALRLHGVLSIAFYPLIILNRRRNYGS